MLSDTERRAARAAAKARYRTSEKGRLTERRYSQSPTRKAYQAQYLQSPAYQETQARVRASNRYREYQARYREVERAVAPEKVRARNAVAMAVRRGKIIRPDVCPHCGRTTRIQAHHHLGYAPQHWLDVQWICGKCHWALHHTGTRM